MPPFPPLEEPPENALRLLNEITRLLDLAQADAENVLCEHIRQATQSNSRGRVEKSRGLFERHQVIRDLALTRAVNSRMAQINWAKRKLMRMGIFGFTIDPST